MSAETGCGCSALELHDGRCAGCGRSVLERMAVPGRPGADYGAVAAYAKALRQRLAELVEAVDVVPSVQRASWQDTRMVAELELAEWRAIEAQAVLAREALKIDLNCSCSPVESAARAVAPWCADHVRESEESRQPREEKPLNYWRGRCGLPMLDPVGPDTPRCFLAQGHPGPHLAECSAQQAAALDVKVEAGSLQPKDGAA